MKPNQAVRWYRAAEAKKGRTIHLGGHARLGASFAKCGKTLGRVMAATDAKYFDPCAACAIEQNKQEEREKKRSAMEAKAPAVEAPKTFDVTLEFKPMVGFGGGLRQEWVSGEGAGIKFGLDSGAGTGNPLLTLWIDKAGKKSYFTADIRALLTQAIPKAEALA